MEKIFKVRLRFMFHYYTALTDPPLRPMLRRDMAGRKVETWGGQIMPDRARFCLILSDCTFNWLRVRHCQQESVLIGRNQGKSVLLAYDSWNGIASIEMYMAIMENIPEVKRLVELLQARRELLPLKALFLKGAVVELNAAHGIGLRWKDIWRVLVEHGYQGSYQQFWRMALLLNGVTPRRSQGRKNLPPPVMGKEIQQPTVQVNGLSTVSNGKPEWQIRREEQMARLDREAELNRQREARLQVKKVFIPSAFVGRGEE